MSGRSAEPGPICISPPRNERRKHEMIDHTRIWSWGGALLLALSLVTLWVWPKFVGVDIHPIFGWAEARTGIGWLEPTGRYVVGATAALLAILVILPRTRFVGAVGAFALSALFIAAHATPWLGWNIPNYGPLMDALAAGRTAAEIEALGLKGDRGAHLSLAIINAGLAILVWGAERTRKGHRTAEHRPRPLELAA
jgi:hypothetical protein